MNFAANVAEQSEPQLFPKVWKIILDSSSELVFIDRSRNDQFKVIICLSFLIGFSTLISSAEDHELLNKWGILFFLIFLGSAGLYFLLKRDKVWVTHGELEIKRPLSRKRSFTQTNAEQFLLVIIYAENPSDVWRWELKLKTRGKAKEVLLGYEDIGDLPFRNSIAAAKHAFNRLASVSGFTATIIEKKVQRPSCD